MGLLDWMFGNMSKDKYEEADCSCSKKANKYSGKQKSEIYSDCMADAAHDSDYSRDE